MSWGNMYFPYNPSRAVLVTKKRQALRYETKRVTIENLDLADHAIVCDNSDTLATSFRQRENLPLR